MKAKITATVETITELSHDTKSFVLRTQEPFEFIAGQFVMVNVPFNNTHVRRAYSLASKQNGNKIELCLNYVDGGKGSEYFFKLKEGDSVSLDGPYGVFTVKETKREKFFICTGTGVVPLRSMIQQLNGAKMTLIFGKRAECDILYREEFEQLANGNQNFRYVVTLSRPHDGWNGERGYVQHVMKKFVHANGEFYVCGLKQMVDDVRKELVGMGVQEEHIHVERYV